MKQTLLASLFSIISFAVLAQPILTNSYNPSVGTSTSTVFCDQSGVIPGPAGANQTWTFNLTPTGSLTTTAFVDVSTTPFTSLFPTANLAWPDDASSNAYSFYDATAASLVYLGRTSSFDTFVYSNPITNLIYPFMFGDSLEDAFAYGTMTDGASGVQKVYYDAYGTLIVNGHTFNNVIRILNVKDDTTYIGASVSPFHGIYYQWIDPTMPGKVLLMITQALGNQFVIASDLAVGNNEPLTIESAFNVYPTLVSINETLTLTYSIDKPQTLLVNLYNCLGGLSRSLKIDAQQNGSLRIPTDLLSKGIYLLTVTDAATANVLTTKKVIID